MTAFRETSQPTREEQRQEEKETGRCEAFSDGVFAVAITLLVLDLKIPPVEQNQQPWALLHSLAVQWPSYVAFVTSFLSILIMWVNHHGIFRLTRKTSSRLLFSNGLLLLVITATPFSTALFSAYFNTPAARAAAAVYGGTFIVAALAYWLVWSTLLRDRSLLNRHASEKVIERISKSYRLGVPIYLAATLGAVYSAYVTLAICTASWIYWSIQCFEEK
jgi:uncharacterized membrane protein